MRRPRFASLLGIWILSAVWLTAAPEMGWAISVGKRAGAGRPAAEWSIRRQAAIGSNGPVSPCRFFEGVLSPLEQDLFADAADGRWDRYSLLAAALLASGVNELGALRRYETRVAELAAELETSGRMTGSPRHRAKVLFEFMHRRILCGGYELDCTDLALALDEGRFNCVSASVLFNCLAARFGLTARGLELPGHVKSRLVLPGGTLDVETTCPDWFRLLDDPKKQAEMVEKTIGVRLPQGTSAAGPREVSAVELVAMIYYNRGVDLLGQEQFAEAVAANAKAWRLDPSSATARGNLLATLNNWAIALGHAGQYAQAVDLLRRGLAIDPGYETFKANYCHVHYQWICDLLARGRRAEATRLAQQAMADPFLRGPAAAVIPQVLSQ